MESEYKARHDPPSLLISDRSGKKKQYVYNLSENRFHTTLIPEFHNMNVFASAYGWLVLVDPETDECCIWNPTSLEKIEIHHLRCSFLFNKCTLSRPPTEPGCQIVFHASNGFNQVFYEIRRIGEDDEDRYVYPLIYCGEEQVFLNAAVSYEGKILCLINPGFRFVILHYEGENVEYVPLLKCDDEPWKIPCPSREWAFLYKDTHLIESPCGRECLLVQRMCLTGYLQDEVDYRVFRVDTNRKECTEVHNIGERVIFLSYGGGGFCCRPSLGIRRNSIYYTVPNNCPMIEKSSSKNLYVFDLDDRGITPLLPCPAARRTQSVLCWVENRVFPKTI